MVGSIDEQIMVKILNHPPLGQNDNAWLGSKGSAFLIDVRFTPRRRHAKGDVRLLRDQIRCRG